MTSDCSPLLPHSFEMTRWCASMGGGCWLVYSTCITYNYQPIVCCAHLLPSTEITKKKHGERHRGYKTVSFLQESFWAFNQPLSSPDTHCPPLLCVCRCSPYVNLQSSSLCVRVCVCLLVFFSRSKVELHGFVDLPVLFADKLEGEGAVQNLWTEFNSWN